MNIFAQENVGHNVLCLIEKDGVQAKQIVRWTHAIIGLTIAKKSFSLKRIAHSEIANIYTEDVLEGWTIIEVGIGE